MNTEQQEQFLKTVKFEKRDIQSKLTYEMKLTESAEKSFDYIYESLFNLKHFTDISKSKNPKLKKKKIREGKNYHWLAVKCNDVKFLIRQYSMHLTIYVKVEKEHRDKYGAFTYHINTDKMDDDSADRLRDLMYNDPFHELNKMLLDIVKLLTERDFHFLWNSVALKRPDYCEIKQAFYNDEFFSIDTFIFCLEELGTLQLELFAENEMLEHLKSLKDVEGKQFDYRYKVKEIKTEFPSGYCEPYYHGVGIKTIDKEGKTEFKDVYSLSRYYLEETFNL